MADALGNLEQHVAKAAEAANEHYSYAVNRAKRFCQIKPNARAAL